MREMLSNVDHGSRLGGGGGGGDVCREESSSGKAIRVSASAASAAIAPVVLVVSDVENLLLLDQCEDVPSSAAPAVENTVMEARVECTIPPSQSDHVHEIKHHEPRDIPADDECEDLLLKRKRFPKPAVASAVAPPLSVTDHDKNHISCVEFNALGTAGDHLVSLVALTSVPHPEDYKIVRKLGHGGEGTVFSAKVVAKGSCLDAHVALKKIPLGAHQCRIRDFGGGRSDAGFCRACRNRSKGSIRHHVAQVASLRAASDHENIVALIDAFVVDEGEYEEEDDNVDNDTDDEDFDGLDDGGVESGNEDGRRKASDGRRGGRLSRGVHVGRKKVRGGPHLWLVMEMMDAGSLRDLLDYTVTMNEASIAHVCWETLQGLRHLHNLGIIHRDVKTENLLLNCSGTIKLADFGSCSGPDSFQPEAETSSYLSHHFSPLSESPNSIPYMGMSPSKRRKHFTFRGTAPYLSPQMAARKPYTSLTDIWSLGIVVIEMIEGEAPYADIADDREVMRAIITNGTPELRDYGRLSRQLLAFLGRCLEVEEARRGDADELLSQRFMDMRDRDQLAMLILPST